MALEWPVDKLGVINRALAMTGNTLCNVADDGSDEWNTASPAYEDALAAMAEDHGWTFLTIAAIPAHSAVAPTDTLFTDAYVKPADLVHLIWVRLDDKPVIYDILNNQIVLNASGTTSPAAGTTPGVVRIKYVSSTNSDPTLATPLFVSALTRFVMAGLYRGLHEDTVEAKVMEKEGSVLLARAKTRSDQEKPKMAPFNSRLLMRRRIRSPYPPLPGGWGGTGQPG